MYNTGMFRHALLLCIAATACVAATANAAIAPVDIDTAAQLYQAAEIREQVRASLGSMPGHIRKLFQGNTSTPLSDKQLAAVNAAAIRAKEVSSAVAQLISRSRRVESMPWNKSGSPMKF